ncbi:flavin-containing monooxygenase [Pseudomonas abyssi]|uniref:flavin-containing monooxygenase n=1 Tax=Pseudomonas abyssi TaxID=170540 RepID=UPI003C7D51DF
MTNEHLDVLIIGAGLSGIGTAVHLSQNCPDKRIAILERRQQVGGTWDLFRYPGIRSDSDMFSFGFAFRPWNDLQTLADGESIRRYISDTAREYGVEQKIRFGIETEQVQWCSEQQQWVVSARDLATGQTRHYSCDFLISCTGYYDHKAGYLPEFPGVERYQGQCIHPQHWPQDLDYSGKKVVVIGSGATAVTLVPAMAPQVGHITMLQRSPSYIMTVPAHDRITEMLCKVLPNDWVFGLARKRNIAIQRWIFKAAKRWPEGTRRFLLKKVAEQLDDPSQMTHFTPSYMPWDQRLCAVPDGDLFKAINSGKASVVTDEIDCFTESGIRLKSGAQLDADIIITATGLTLQVLGGTRMLIDGRPFDINQRMTYKGVMLQDVPNMAWIFGYTNAPWTLKSDIAAQWVCRLLNHMRAAGVQVATPRDHDNNLVVAESMMGALQSGYVQRGNTILPRQGRSAPWRLLNAYERDREMLLEEPVEDTMLELTERTRAAKPGPTSRDVRAA